MSDQDLAMMGEARVRKTRWQGKTAIHKAPVHPTEAYFYREVLSQSGASGIGRAGARLADVALGSSALRKSPPR